MNIKFITMNQAPGGVVEAVESMVLPLCGQGLPEGQAVGLMPIKLAPGVVVTPKVTVYSSTSTNRRGAVSAVIKVSIPYTALKLNDGGDAVVGTDAARSGAELSMHTVITIPAAGVSDLQGANGSLLTSAAERLAAVVVRLHSALLGERFSDPGFAMAANTHEDGNVDPGLEPAPHIWRVGDTIGGPAVVETSGRSLVPSQAIDGFVGNTGFDVTSYSAGRDLSEILSRIVQKQAPLGCSDIIVRSIVTDSTWTPPQE